MTSAARAPCEPAFRMARAGMMVTKMAAKSFATSRMGPQLNSLASRSRLGVL